jgi:hypothetical protein
MAINVLKEQVLPKMNTPRKFKVSLWRRLMTVFATVMVIGSFVFVAAMFLSIIVDVLIHAWPALNIKLLTDITNGIGGGLKKPLKVPLSSLWAACC